MNTRTRRRILRTFAVAAVLLVTSTAAEFAARVYLAQHPQLTFIDYRANRPPAYAEAPYWSDAFWNEQKAMNKFHQNEDGSWTADDFAGTYYNIKEDVRTTTDQPARASHTLWMFGSSTLFDSEVPDAYTISSYLQRLIGSRYKVVNMGQSGAAAFHELNRLKASDVRPGDLVIFYDGYVDAMEPYTIANNRRHANATVCNWLTQRYSQIALVTLACNLDTYPPSEVLDDATLDQSIASMYHDYERTINKAKTYAQTHGAAFYHVISPQMWSGPLNAVERRFIANPAIYPNIIQPQIDRVITRAYPIIEQEPGAIDLTHVLDHLRHMGTMVYLDDHHMTERGNEIIANAIYGAVRQAF